jgi:hypothetical protein
MSLASHNPEKFEEACLDAIAAHLTGTWYKPAYRVSEQEFLEEVRGIVAELPYKPAGRAVFDALMDLPGVGSNALDRFHEMFR